MPYPRDPKNGYLVGPDDCHYSNEHQIHHFAELKLCGCGLPEKAYNFCRDLLVCFDRRDKTKWIDAERAVENVIKSDIETAAHVFSHLLSHLGLLEHGGTVGGSWLTDKGAAIVDLRPATEEDMDADEPLESI